MKKIIIILCSILTLCGVITLVFFFSPIVKNNIAPQNPIEQKRITQNRETGREKQLFYVKGGDMFQVYMFNPDSSQPDTLVYETKGYVQLFDKFPQRREILLGEGSALVVVSLDDKKETEIVNVSEGMHVDHASYSPDGSTIAYSVSGQDTNAKEPQTKGEVFLYSLKDHSQQKIFSRNPLAILSILQIYEWRDKSIVVTEIGGDAGGYGETRYEVSLAKPYPSKKLLEQSGSSDQKPIDSPDHQRSFTVQCKEYYYLNGGGDPMGCKTGEDLILSENGKEKVLFSQHEYKDMDPQSYDWELNRIFTPRWRDNDHVAFSLYSGIYEMNIKTGERKNIYPLHWVQTDDVIKNRPYIVYIDENSLIFSLDYNYDDLTIVDRKTGKAIRFPQPIGDNSKSSDQYFRM